MLRRLLTVLPFCLFAFALLLTGAPVQAADITCGFTLSDGDQADIDLDAPACVKNGALEEIIVLNDTVSGNGITFYVDNTRVTSVSFTGTYPSVVSADPFYDVECFTADACNFTFNATFDGSDPVELNVVKAAGSNVVSFGSGSVGSQPEIAVAETGQGQGAVADGGTLAQGSQTAGSALTLTFTVTNSGDADLTIATATSSSLTNVTVNSIGAPSSTTVSSGGGTETFTVQYTPTIAGAFSFDLSFVNDDSDENPYNFTVSGTATGTPEISVAETGQGQGAVADGGTLAQGSQTAGSALTLTFTVTNSGTDDLTIATATSSSLTNVTVNSIGAPSSTTVSPSGGTETFTVQYTPTIAGAFSFDLSFVNDDSDENPYNFTVSGTATGTPEISVAETGQGQGAVADGGTLAQGSQAAGSALTLTFTVTNSGTDDLTIATATSSSLTNVTVNSIGAPSSTTVSPSGGTETFTVQYTPTIAGAFSFDLSFVNDDSDENPYNFTVSGTATGTPEISVAETGQGQGAVADGGTLAQGSQAAGSALTLTFTVTNSGTDDLTIATATSSSLTNVTVNSIGAPSSTTVSPSGGTETFTVQYTPTVAGAFSFDLSFVNDDSDENPYNFTVSGTATGTPEISVAETGQGQGAVADGGTLAQGSQAAGSALTLTFTVTNSGTDDLTIATATSSSLTNVTVNSIGAPSSTTVSPSGGTETFTVQYTPTIAGAFSFDLSFVNDDSDENPYNFTVSGTATGTPEISVSETGQGQGAVADGGTLAQGSQAAGSALTLTFTVTNSGTDDLTIATATSSSLTNVTVNSIGAPSSTTVAPSGGTETFTVQYTPTAAGAFSFNLSFVNDDSDENPYNFTVSGTATSVPTFSQAFAPDTIVIGGTSTVTFTIDNTANASAATSLDFTDNLPAGVTVETPANASTTCTGGTLTAVSGSGVVSYTGGTVGAGSTCAVDVDVTASSDGAYVNTTGDLTSSLGNSGTSADTLTVSSPEIDVQRPAGNSIADGGTDSQGSVTIGVQQTLTYTIENTGTATLTITGTPTGSAASNVTVDSISAPGSSSLAGSATTTFTVLYTTTAVGAFSFELDIISDDADEGTYDILVSGTSAGTPEIDVSSSESGSIADGGTDTVSGSVSPGVSSTITYTITNNGTGALSVTTPTVGANVTSTTNATVNSFTLSSTSVSSGGGTATLEVDYTTTAAGSFGFDFNFVNDDADENPFNITVSGSSMSSASGLSATSGSGQATEINTQFGSVLVATVTDNNGNGVAGVDVTFTAPSTGASLTFASTGTTSETVTTAGDGTASSSAMTANSTASSYGGSGSLTPYSVTASASGLTSVSFSLTNERDSEADIQKTKEVIASFVTNRANTIVSGQPDIVSRLTSGPFGQQSGRNGFNFNVTPYSQSGNFQFSLRAFANSIRRGAGSGAAEATADAGDRQPGVAAPDRYAAFDSFSSTGTMSYTAVAPQVAEEDTLAILSGTNGDAPTAATGSSYQSGWDFWAQGTFAITNNNNSDSHTGLLFAGVDYRYKDRAVVGLMGQLDVTEENNGSANTSANGVGWMAGPYGVLRVHQNFYLDGIVTYGQSYNSVNALGLFEDDFRTQRFLLQGGLTGDFKLNETTRVSPFARITYYYEEQESYTDTLGRLIPSQDFDLGRLEFGPKVSWDLQLNDLLFSPFLSLSGIYDFNKLQDATPTDATLASSDEDLRARLEAGAGLLVPGRGIRISGEGFFDGIGTDDFRSYGATLNVTIPF